MKITTWLASPCSSCFVLLLLIFTTGNIVVVERAEGRCVLAVRGGGCPDKQKCREVCSACYRGVGHIVAFCRSAGGGNPFDECMCDFQKGAPCTPPGPPKCPGCPPSLSPFTRFINVTPHQL